MGFILNLLDTKYVIWVQCNTLTVFWQAGAQYDDVVEALAAPSAVQRFSAASEAQQEACRSAMPASTEVGKALAETHVQEPEAAHCGVLEQQVQTTQVLQVCI